MIASRSPAIGSLTDRVQLQRREQLVEADGGTLTLFVPVAMIWARVRDLNARMAVASDARSAAITHSVVLRFRVDVRPGDRLVHQGRVLDIVGASDLNGRRAFLACTCSEIAVTG